MRKQVMTQTTIDGTDIAVLYVPFGQSAEAVVIGPTLGTPTVTGSSSVKARSADQSVIITGSPVGVSVVRFGTTAVIVTDKAAAATFWNPRTSASYDVSPDTSSVIVSGPYLVRNATVSSSTLQLFGDTNGKTNLIVIAPATVKSITWNGALVEITNSPLGIGLSGTLSGVTQTPSLPSLKSAAWKSADSLPEIAPSFDDSTWVTANKTSTARPFKPFSGKLVLYTDEYGQAYGFNYLYGQLTMIILLTGFHQGLSEGLKLRQIHDLEPYSSRKLRVSWLFHRKCYWHKSFSTGVSNIPDPQLSADLH
jgi:hypothetical protein